jgi:transcriptional regulator with XRE-family HTH domain
MTRVNLRKAMGLAIKFCREKKGISQMELGEIAGICQKHISDLELGKRNPALLTLDYIAVRLFEVADGNRK